MADPVAFAPLDLKSKKYRAWAKRLKRSMRQIHPGGKRLIVDYAGQTVPVVDAVTGEAPRAGSTMTS